MEDILVKIIKQPHLLGHLCGYDKLTELHSRWINYIWNDNRKKSLQAHRGSYKTTAIVIVGIIRHMLFNPNDRILYIRKTYKAAATVLQTIRLCMKRQKIRELFKIAHGSYPELLVERENKLVFSFKRTTTPEGNIEISGINFGMVGSHYDVIVCDDFINGDDRKSKTEREKTFDIIREVQTNIIDPGKPVYFIGTPWHKYDAWRQDDKRIIPKPIKFDIYDTGLLSDEDLKKVSPPNTTPSLFAANYLLKHESDSDLLFANPLEGMWQFSAPGEVVAQLDTAYDGTNSNALTIIKKSDKYNAVGFVYSGNIQNWISEIVEYLKHYRVNIIYVEDNADKGYTAKALEKVIKIPVIRYHESQNKHVKISTYLYKEWANIYWDTGRTDMEYLEQITDYRKGQELDDAPDSAASLIREHFYNEEDDILWKW